MAGFQKFNLPQSIRGERPQSRGGNIPERQTRRECRHTFQRWLVKQLWLKFIELLAGTRKAFVCLVVFHGSFKLCRGLQSNSIQEKPFVDVDSGRHAFWQIHWIINRCSQSSGDCGNKALIHFHIYQPTSKSCCLWRDALSRESNFMRIEVAITVWIHFYL